MKNFCHLHPRALSRKTPYLAYILAGLWILLFLQGFYLAGQFPPSLTLQQAIDLALEQHPEIRAAEAKAKGSEGLIVQAGLRPNPSFTFQSENWRFGDTPAFHPGQQVDWFAYFSQPIETGGKRQQRLALSRKESTRFQLEKQLFAWKIRQLIKQSFWKALAAQKELDLATTIQNDFQTVLEYHQNRFEQGVLAEADLIKVRLEGERLDLTLQSALMTSEQARIDLLKAMALQNASSSFKLVSPDLALLLAEGVSRGVLLEKACQSRGEVQLLQLELEQAESRLSLQKAQSKPDLDAILGYKRTEGFNTLLAGVSIPVPFFNRNQGNIFQSGQELVQIRERLRAATIQTEKEIDQAIVALKRRQLMLRQLRKGMVERAEESWKIALSAYREGGLDLLRLLDAQRSRNEIQLLQSRTQIDFQLSLIDLENSVGEENLPLGEGTLGIPSP
jgi:cobalt-zinc-cadmium efflux system outer membrane protein